MVSVLELIYEHVLFLNITFFSWGWTKKYHDDDALVILYDVESLFFRVILLVDLYFLTHLIKLLSEQLNILQV